MSPAEQLDEIIRLTVACARVSATDFDYFETLNRRNALVRELRQAMPADAVQCVNVNDELRWIVNGFLEWHEGNPCPDGLIERARAAVPPSEVTR